MSEYPSTRKSLAELIRASAGKRKRVRQPFQSDGRDDVRKPRLSRHAKSLISLHHSIGTNPRLSSGFLCSRCGEGFYVKDQAELDEIDAKKLAGERPLCPACRAPQAPTPDSAASL